MLPGRPGQQGGTRWLGPTSLPVVCDLPLGPGQVGEKCVPCHSESVCVCTIGPRGPRSLSRSRPRRACWKCLLLHLRGAACRMLAKLFVDLAPCLRSHKPVFPSSCCPAVCCFETLFQARLQCALPGFCLTSRWVSASPELSSQQLFGIPLVSIFSCRLRTGLHFLGLRF